MTCKITNIFTEKVSLTKEYIGFLGKSKNRFLKSLKKKLKFQTNLR